ncbi:hypothetical protein ACUSIJ_24720 [Pseudochelatococcus sp. B33]
MTPNELIERAARALEANWSKARPGPIDITRSDARIVIRIALEEALKEVDRLAEPARRCLRDEPWVQRHESAVEMAEDIDAAIRALLPQE